MFKKGNRLRERRRVRKESNQQLDRREQKDGLEAKFQKVSRKLINYLKIKLTSTEKEINKAYLEKTKDIESWLDKEINKIIKIEDKEKQQKAIDSLKRKIFRKRKVIYEQVWNLIKEYLEGHISLVGKVQEKTLASLVNELERDKTTGLLKLEPFIIKIREFYDNAKDAYFVFLDANNLKRINDNYGHEFGDLFINALSDALVEIAEEVDPKGKGNIGITLSRLYADEFGMFFASKEKIDKVLLEKIIKRAEERFKDIWYEKVKHKLKMEKEDIKKLASFSYGYTRKNEIEKYMAKYKKKYPHKRLDPILEMINLTDTRMYIKKTEEKIKKIKEEIKKIKKIRPKNPREEFKKRHQLHILGNEHREKYMQYKRVKNKEEEIKKIIDE